MSASVLRRVLVLSAILALPAAAFAQEATLTGTVTDSTGGVLPGVTVTAVLEATGNTFVAVTDDRGRLPHARARRRVPDHGRAPGLHDRRAERACSCSSGRQLVVNLQMSPSTLAETMTVTAEAPLLKVSSSSLGGNIDPKQVQEMPVQGRDWGALLLLAPGQPHDVAT